jgi:predicted ATPase
MAGVSITLLGGFAAAVDGEPVPEKAWRLKKARELVKLLALAPEHRLHRDQAMDVLWRELGAAAAANNLNQAVHVARRALGSDAIEVRDELLRLEAEVDVDRLEQAAADARRAGTAAAYRAALWLYGGELLPENRYDDWAIERRDEVETLHAELLQELASLGTVGDGLRPLPVETSSFVGRGHELAELTALLAGTRLLTLAGTGGAGKTRLAIELARGAESSYTGGAALVELATVEDPGLVPGAAAAALDLRALPGQELMDALVDFVGPRHLLIVLDNCEHVLGASAALADALLRAAPRLTILATSREPLRLPGEVVFRVPSLAIPRLDRQLALEELLQYEAVRLFVERAAAAAPGFELDADNAADVARICVRLDGLPLALELAAGRLGALSAASVAERLDDRFRLLRAGSAAAPTRQQTLEAALAWSHDLLESAEKVLLRRLAVFAGGFDLPAVEAVAGDESLDIREIADTLARLVEKSLVTAEDGGRERRYRLLETVRLFARERLDEAGETADVAARHAWWALDLAEYGEEPTRLDREVANLRVAHDTLLATRPRDALRLCVALWEFWLRRIDLAEANRRFEQTLAAMPERTPARARGLLAAAALHLRSGGVAHGMALAQESLAIATELGDVEAEWRALHFLGDMGSAYVAEEAIPWLEMAVALARREGVAAGEALGANTQALARWFAGDPEGADELLGRSAELFCALEGVPGKIPAPINIGEVRSSVLRERPVLRMVLEVTMQPFVEISIDAAIAYTLANRATVARVRGELERASALLDEAAERFARLQHEEGEADVLVRRAHLHVEEGSLDDARRCFEWALEVRRRLNDRRGIGLVLAGLGLVNTAAGEYESAERHLAEARDLFRRAGDRWGLATTLYRVADLAFARGRVDDAEAALLEAVPVARETRLDRWIADALAGLAEVAARRGDGERASELFAEARDRYARSGDRLSLAATDERLRAVLTPR